MEIIPEIEDLKSLSTIQKILVLQGLLKEMESEKKRFIDNKNKMIEKLDSNCYKYFQNLIYMKEIFDYCNAQKPEAYIKYEIIQNPKNYLNDVYQALYDFCFLIRKDNSLMLKIIELSDNYLFSELSNFFVNFLYVNIIKGSFEEDELMTMIYLLLEKAILKTLPGIIEGNNNIPISYFNKSFLFYVFRDLTRKIDLKNFLSTILYDFIIRMESFSTSLSVDINTVNKFLGIRDRNKFHSFIKNMSSIKEEEVHKIKKKFLKMQKTDELFKQNSTGNMQLKRTKKIVLGESVRFGNFNNNNNGKLITLEEALSGGGPLIEEETKLDEEKKNFDFKKFEKRKTEGNNNMIKNDIENETDNKNVIQEKEKETEKIDLNSSKNKIFNRMKKQEEELDENGQVKIDDFFELNSITFNKLKDILSKYEKNKDDKNNINLAMKEYLKILISNKEVDKNDIIKKKDSKYDIIDEEKIMDNEIYSTSLIIDDLKSIRYIKEDLSFRNMMRKIKFNHRVITNIITEIINKLKDNLVSSPYCLKIISKIIEILLNKYNDSSKNKLSNYQIFMFEINFLIGNIILPILKNPEYNGVVSNIVISDLTKENLSIISNILDKIITGSLFNKSKDKYMTIFNKFIIETMPMLFELVQNIEKNFELPDIIKNLIDNSKEKPEKRNINYDFFSIYTNENINYQSICFSWKTIYIIYQILDTNRKLFIDENKNIEQKIILNKFLEKKDYYSTMLTNNLKNHKNEYLYFTKISYGENFNKIMTAIIKDNFIYIVPKSSNDLITAFKKCMIEVLNYANKIEQENFYQLTENKEKTIPKKSKKQKGEQNEKKTRLRAKRPLRTSLIKIALGNKSDDADYKNILFPQIKKNITLEINYNVNNENAQRIIFCTNYINLYIRNLSEKYKKNNYSLLFDELIIETENYIQEMNSNILLEFYKKLKEAEKLNMKISVFKSQVNDLEKLKCIQYLYNKLLLPVNFNIEKDPRNIISKIEYKLEQNSSNKNQMDIMEYLKSVNQPIKNMINEFPDFHVYEEEYDNILDIEENANTPVAINDYFSAMIQSIKKEKIMKRYNEEEKKGIINDLKNYILSKLYDKLFPFELTKQDIFFYNKCKRLQFIKPENFIKDKKIINENLWEQVIEYFHNLDDQLTPFDKLKSIIKAIGIMQNSITFSSGKDNLGVDDVTNPLVYVLLKSKPKNIISNYKYCELYLDSEVGMGNSGIVLSQLYMFINIIKNMKYNDLIGVSEEQFGKDEVIEQ